MKQERGHRGEGSYRVNAVLGKTELDEIRMTAREKGITNAEALRRIVGIKSKLRDLGEKGYYLTIKPKDSEEQVPIVPIDFLLQ